MAVDALRPVVGQWINKIRIAWQFKKTEFQDDADECYRFFDGPYDWLYSPWKAGMAKGFSYTSLDDESLPGPSAQMTVNKVAELVQLFGPALYHRNPVRTVNPRKIAVPPPEMLGFNPNDPMAMAMAQQMMGQIQGQIEQDEMRAKLLEKYLNYTPTPLDLKTEARWMITEALIKGMGVLWTQKHNPPGATMSWVGSFFDSVDNLVLDPDAENIRDIKWLARRRCRPVWEVEKEFRLPQGTLKSKASLESYGQQAAVASDRDGDYRRKQGTTSDLVVYWEIYSKMGMGGRLSGIEENMRQSFDMLGDYVYLAVCESCPYPLNIPPALADVMVGEDPNLLQQLMPEIQNRTSWQTPHWADNGWPVSWLVFHWRPKKLYPMSHMKPGIGELKFLNWAWSFLASKVRIASRDFVAIAKSAGEELKDRIQHGSDYSILEIENLHGSIDNVVKFLQHPNFNKELYEVIGGVSENFERRVGLTELMYGMSARQMRSAQEAQIKSDAVNVRPDDMANQVEDAMTDVARKEAFAARWHLRGQDVVHPLGPVGAQMWEQLIVPSDPASIIYSLEYRIEAGTARKPNRALEVENLRQAIQMLFQPLFQFAQATGNVGPVNALLSDWAKSIDLNADKYQLPEPPPPPPPQPEAYVEGGPGSPSPGIGQPQQPVGI